MNEGGRQSKEEQTVRAGVGDHIRKVKTHVCTEAISHLLEGVKKKEPPYR